MSKPQAPATIASLPHAGFFSSSRAYVVVVACWLTYSLLILLAPQTNPQYHLDPTRLAVLRLSIIIPVHLIWLAAAYGAVTFKKYATAIQGSPEAPAFNDIANGLLLTGASLILGALIGAAIPLLKPSGLLNVVVVIHDHLPALGALAAFALLYRGSHHLRIIANFTTWAPSTFVFLGGFLIFTFAFALDYNLSPDTASATPNSLSMLPHSLLLFTLVLPYLIGWFMGLLASINISKYASQVKGVLYRRALKNLVLGIWTVIFLNILIQAIIFANRFFANLNLGWAILLVYLLLLIYGAGFMFIRSGAKKLTKIEIVQ